VLAKEEEVVGLKEELSEIQKEENKLKAEKLGFDQKIDSINKDIHENKVKIPALRKQVRNCFCVHLIDVPAVGNFCFLLYSVTSLK
jgi:predicted  nucleic acid-binding Zn-ribbon protein